MSSKKKEKKKGDKSKKEKKQGPEPVIEVIDETSKQFYLLQIKDLEEKLIRYQKKSDELEILCKKYEGEYDALSNDKKDIISNLKKELERKADEILDLNDRLVGLQQAKDAEKEAFEKQLTDLRTEFQETKDFLTNQNNSLLAKLAALDEFKTQKEDLLAKLADLEQKIRFLELEHQDKLYEIEKKMVLDKDRLKKDMIVRVNQVAADFRRVSNKQMADTTKRTIRENVSINAQLQKMSEKIVELMGDNDKTKNHEKDFKQQINLLEDNEKELAKKNASNIKVIRMLTEKCRNQEILIAELEEKFNEMQDYEINNSQIKLDLEQKSKDLEKIVEENQKLRNLISVLEEEIKNVQSHRLKIENVIKNASHSLKMVLLKDTSVAKASSLENIQNERNVEDEKDEWSDIEKRNNMLESLLVLLNSATELGFERVAKQAVNSLDRRPKSASDVQKSKLEAKNTNHHYNIGDLGLVPRVEDHLLSNKEKMKILHPKKELGNLQRVTRKTVATQTIDLTKASIFNKIDYLMDDNDEKRNMHSFFEASKVSKKTKNTTHPLTSLNRVTNKVF